MYIEMILGWVFLIIGLFMAILSFSKSIKGFCEILLFIAGLCLIWHGSSVVHNEYIKSNKNIAISTQFFQPEFNGR